MAGVSSNLKHAKLGRERGYSPSRWSALRREGHAPAPGEGTRTFRRGVRCTSTLRRLASALDIRLSSPSPASLSVASFPVVHLDSRSSRSTSTVGGTTSGPSSSSARPSAFPISSSDFSETPPGRPSTGSVTLECDLTSFSSFVGAIGASGRSATRRALARLTSTSCWRGWASTASTSVRSFASRSGRTASRRSRKWGWRTSRVDAAID